MDFGSQTVGLHIGSEGEVLPLEPNSKAAEMLLIRLEEIGTVGEDFASNSNAGSDFSDTSEKELVLAIRETVNENTEVSDKEPDERLATAIEEECEEEEMKEMKEELRVCLAYLPEHTQ